MTADPHNANSGARRPNQGIWVILGLGLLFFAIMSALLVSTGREPRRPVAEPEDLHVVPTTLRLRTAPDLDAPVLADLERGEKLDQLATEGSWVQVRRADGTTGWAERSYLETTSEHERRVARARAIRLLPPLLGEVERKIPLYAGPGIFYPIVGELDGGSNVTVFTRDHDFYAVDAGGDVAFVEVDAIDLSGAGAAVFEVAADGTETVIDEEEPTLTASIPEDPPFEIPMPIPPPRSIPDPEPAPAPAPPRGGIYPGVPPGGTEPVVIDRAIPSYPAAARANGVEGTVVVRAVVRTNGRVGDVEILRDLPYGLGEAAARAVKRWRFRPATYQGRPIAVYYNVTVNFRLSG
ncbi:MAG TPA: TonB family protein [Thermoanaerobaculia bacterium]|nr:TonB family protein [Thermoanaerobaculia bacterium]